jgi:hypothetical protein
MRVTSKPANGELVAVAHRAADRCDAGRRRGGYLRDSRLVADELTRRSDRLLDRRLEQAAFRDPQRSAGEGSSHRRELCRYDGAARLLPAEAELSICARFEFSGVVMEAGEGVKSVRPEVNFKTWMLQISR